MCKLWMKCTFSIKLYLSDEKQVLYFSQNQLSSEKSHWIGLSESFNLSLFFTLEMSFVSSSRKMVYLNQSERQEKSESTFFYFFFFFFKSIM